MLCSFAFSWVGAPREALIGRLRTSCKKKKRRKEMRKSNLQEVFLDLMEYIDEFLE